MHNDIIVTPASRHALDTFLQCHYIPRPPFTPELTLQATVGGRIAGVLSISRPALNGSWRTFIPVGIPARARAKLLNDSLRTISRVIVSSTFRGRGVATALVRAYLNAPLTAHTEAIASMGYANPFFERAGMQHVGELRSQRDHALRRSLDAIGVSPLQLLRRAAMREIHADSPLYIALARWANDSRATRAFRSSDPATIATVATLAASRLTAPPRIYLHSITSSSALVA